jgi:hypothetical protein
MRWAGVALTVAYTVLLVVTGYVAFFREDYIASTDPEQYKALQNTKLTDEQRATFRSGMDQLTANNQKRQELAFQSFNIVLGAALGYLSAQAARRKTD